MFVHPYRSHVEPSTQGAGAFVLVSREGRWIAALLLLLGLGGLATGTAHPVQMSFGVLVAWLALGAWRQERSAERARHSCEHAAKVNLQ